MVFYRYKELRDSIVSFVKQKRVVMSLLLYCFAHEQVFQNPMDYLSQQKLDNLVKQSKEAANQVCVRLTPSPLT